MTLTAYPAPRRVSADRIKRIEDELIGGGGGGGGGSTMSARPLFNIQGTCPPPDANPTLHFLSSVTIAIGEDYWGTPGSAQPLAMTVDDNGDLYYPDSLEDAIFDIHTTITFTADPADAGKAISVRTYGNDATNAAAAIISPNGQAGADFDWVDRLYLGDNSANPVRIQLQLSTTGVLTAPITQLIFGHTVMQR